MKVRVKLFATLSRYAVGVQPGTAWEVELPEGATLQDLIDHLRIPSEEARVAFVNGLSRSMDWVLQPGDEVGVFPPIAGG